MTPALFAILGLDNAEDRLAQLVKNCLMVAGGFLVGYFLGGCVAWGVNRYALRRKRPDQRLPEPVVRTFRLIGGVVVALIVALIVFTGGLGGGPGKGSGDGSGNPDPNTPSDKSGQPKIDDPKIDPKITVPKPPDPKPVDVTLPILILGGDDVRDGRFYVIGSDRTPKTFDEFKDVVLARKAKETGKLGLEVMFPAKNVLPLDHPAVTRVIKWAKEEARLKVAFAEDR